MRLLALATARGVRLAACAALGALVCLAVDAQPDPPDQAGRLSAVYGTVSIQPSGSDDWGQAGINLPLGPGDRIYTDQDGRAEIQVGQTFLRIGPNTDITLVNDDPSGIVFGLAQGSAHVRALGMWQGQNLDISTPNGDARLNMAGELRVDALPGDGVTIFTSVSNGVVVTGAGGFWQQLGGWQSLELAGSNPVQPQWLQPAPPDDLDQWSQQRDRMFANAAAYSYVSPEMPGAADLDANGDWMPDSDYGPIWFPRAVPMGWAPYRYGHWINRDPWGWVWVEDEPWGYAPFHYGRWVSYRGRWGWVPGPREQRPIWSPALVVFAGGVNVGGAGVSAWFPLGPGEAYRPWYPCSPRYIDRVNITNIRESRVVHVQTTYVNIVRITNVTYVNRSIAVSAMRPEDFAAGRPVRQAAVQVDVRQMDRVTVVDRPAPGEKRPSVSRPVNRPVPVSGNHPVFINQKGLQISTRPGAPPVQPPVRTVPPAQVVQGRTVAAPPAESRFQNPTGNRQVEQHPGAPVGKPIQPNTPSEGRQFTPPAQNPAQQGPSNPSVRPLPPNQQPSQPRQINPPNQPQLPANNAPRQQPAAPQQTAPVDRSNPQPHGAPPQPQAQPKPSGQSAPPSPQQEQRPPAPGDSGQAQQDRPHEKSDQAQKPADRNGHDQNKDPKKKEDKKKE